MSLLPRELPKIDPEKSRLLTEGLMPKPERGQEVHHIEEEVDAALEPAELKGTEEVEP